ncbi:bromodomain-containing protein 1 [Phtheirospermum japonicum]|uniref:Bromodomain-containing protein 1 n=1 Tax=Phtheirospermum japonicum TaxID=374723 RepID=A0A830CPS2_9LAMI|nr:bromodomain-containing protein 1 [Phtheirospermum japonicum]
MGSGQNQTTSFSPSYRLLSSLCTFIRATLLWTQIVKRKKKGRPPKSDLVARQPPPSPPPRTAERDLRRSHRRRNVKYVFDLDDYYDEDELFDDDEDQRRREKKLKLLLKLESESNTPEETRYRRVDQAPATSASYSSDDGKPSKKRKIDGYLNEDVDDENGDAHEEDNYNDEDEEEEEEEEEEVRERKQEIKTEESPPGTPVEAASYGLPLPDKKALELILDKLQKKDIYGVYAEPVDPEELPDYHDIIEHPMDFATVRSKLGNGSYATLEQFESDVFLICSNAMQYNSSDTVYYKQARTIQELAKRKLEKVRLSVERTEKEIKSEQKSGSGLKKQIKRSLSRTPQEPVGSDFSSGATLANAGDIQNLANAFQAVGSEKPGNIIDGLVEANSFFNDNNLDKAEDSFPGKGLLSRFGRKTFVHDENRRATYTISQSHPVLSSDSIFSTFDGETKQLVPVGLYSDHSYARSLARFAATLGSVAWEVASKRIEQALPQGFKFGQGWVGEYEPLPTPVLMLENCSVKEPPFMAKVLPPPPVPRKLEKKIPANSKTESPTSVRLAEHKLPFFSPTQTIRRNNNNNISETNPSFFLSPRNPNNGSHNLTYQHQNLSPRFNPNNGSHNLNYQHQNLSPRAFVESDKKIPNHTKLNGPDRVSNRQASRSSEIEPSRSSMQFSPKSVNLSPSGPFKQSDSNGVAFQRLPDGKIVGKTNQGQGLSDPVQLVRHLAEKAHTQQKPDQSHQVLPSPPNFNDSNNATLAAARAWMSVGSGGFRPPIVAENGNKNNNQIHADSLYNSTRDMQPQQVSRFHGSGLQQHGFVPQGSVPMMMVGGNNHQMMQQFQNQRMGFVQLANADLSRLQLQSTWRGSMSPQMHSRQRQPESLPPDLNIGFQSSGSPGRPSSGVLVDSQQPDLALQL